MLDINLVILCHYHMCIFPMFLAPCDSCPFTKKIICVFIAFEVTHENKSPFDLLVLRKF